MKMKATTILGCLGVLLAVALGASSAQANRALITEEAVSTKEDPKQPTPPPEGQIEGACGVSIGPDGNIYVSDYYHRAVDVFGSAGDFKSQIPAATPPEGSCQLAFDSKGALYANLWHESVVRLKPTFQLFDEANSTGVAVDSSGDVYVNDRTYVAVYEPSGALAEVIGAGGSLKDAYGLAVFAGRVYVPDAFDHTVKVFEPSLGPLEPIDTITGFNSLVDGEVAIDPTNGHILVLDNLQPGYEHPKAAIKEFDSKGAFLGQLKETVIDGEPSGLAIDPTTGNLYATSGNSEEANVFAFGPYTEGGPEALEAAPEAPASPGAANSGGVDAAGEALGVRGTSAADAPRAAGKAARRRTHRRAGPHRAHGSARHHRWPHFLPRRT